jgi:hypothetical protein
MTDRTFIKENEAARQELAELASAGHLYRGLGFVEAGPYQDNPTPGAIYLRLSL